MGNMLKVEFPRRVKANTSTCSLHLQVVWFTALFPYTCRWYGSQPSFPTLAGGMVHSPLSQNLQVVWFTALFPYTCRWYGSQPFFPTSFPTLAGGMVHSSGGSSQPSFPNTCRWYGSQFTSLFPYPLASGMVHSPLSLHLQVVWFTALFPYTCRWYGSQPFFPYTCRWYGSQHSFPTLAGGMVHSPLSLHLQVVWFTALFPKTCRWYGSQPSFPTLAGGMVHSPLSQHLQVVWFTARWYGSLFPYVVLFILMIRGATLPGAADGVKYYLTPNFTRLASSQVRWGYNS